MKIFYLLAIFTLFFLSVFATPAQTPATLSAAQREDALKAIDEKFRELYVVPEMRPLILKKLNDAKQSGRYDVSDARQFAELITKDLRDVAHDEHLALSVDPAAYAAAMAPPTSDSGEEAFRRRRAIRNHHGLAEMRILPGNIRYLKITHFEWVPGETPAIYDDAMRFLKDGDAWIVDLRGNGGGTSSAADYFSSHFFDPGTVSFTSARGSGPADQSGTSSSLPAGRLKGKPLYILIDGGVGSAAEAVAYNLQQFKLAELVGARTVGAANNNKLLPIAPNFILSISYDRPIHVISKTNWEGVGVRPNVECSPVEALDVAHLLILKRLTAMPGNSPENQLQYDWARTAAEARVHPVTISRDRLKRWVGHYGKANDGLGEMGVVFENGALWLERPNRPRTRMSPLTPDGMFALEGSDWLRVRLTDKTLELFWWEYPAPRIYLKN